jgi:hypothetical protein
MKKGKYAQIKVSESAPPSCSPEKLCLHAVRKPAHETKRKEKRTHSPKKARTELARIKKEHQSIRGWVQLNLSL